jgi:acyl transferase domain-containing protein/NADPH:quinone reductase-like Zn-dependent oxidoreductase/short-subunit dehydrogenase
MASADPIAIIGLACRFPGAADTDAYWSLLNSDRDAIGEIGPDRWATAAFRHPRRGEPGFTDTFAAGVLDSVRDWDAEFFGISPREAAQIDPQQLLMLELAWEAIEDAGIPAARLAGSDTAVFVGASAQDEVHAHLGDMAGIGPHAMTGTALSIIANRVSWALDLKGESLTIDTACSSSLVALHQACGALAAGRASAALVGGVNLLLSPFPFIGFARAGMISPTGRCRPFSAEANGYVRAEGGAVVMLKPLAAALAAGDPIRAVIHATAANADGRTSGLALPATAAQAALLRRVYRDGLTPDRLGYVEAHGTGTPVGDPAEAAAIGTVLGQARAAALPIGSAKGHVGHLEPAAGMAGLVKAVLALEHGAVPPSLGAEAPNPAIPFAELNLAPTAAPVPLADGALIGVSSFGFGGANAHATLGRAPTRPAAAPPQPTALPLLLSARSEAALRDLLAAWRARLADLPAGELPGLARAAARARDHHAHRAVILPAAPAEMAAAIDQHLGETPSPAIVTGRAPAQQGGIAFVFSGNGTQWAGMGREAFAADSAFRRAVEAIDAVFRPRAGWSVAAALRDGVEDARLASAEIAQPLLFAVQAGIVAALAEQDVVPQAVLGHSVGEVAAAHAAGALSLEDAVAVIHARSTAQAALRGCGRMAAVGLSAVAAETAIAEAGGGLAVAAINAPGHVTLAGPAAALERFAALAAARGWMVRDLGLDYAYHSAAMDPAEGPLRDALGTLAPRPGAVPFVSTVAAAILPGESLDAGYWWRNVRAPVRFDPAVRALAATGVTLALEVGPHPVLQAYLREIFRDADHAAQVTYSLSRGAGGALPGAAAARCHVLGADLSRAARFDGARNPRSLPRYPWQRRPYRSAPTVEAIRLTDPQSDHPLLGWRRTADRREWLRPLDLAILPALADHRIGGTALFPAAGFVELVLAAGVAGLPGEGELVVSDLEIRRPLALDADRTRLLRTRISVTDRIVEIASRQRLVDEAWTVHAVARLGRLPTSAPERLPPAAAGDVAGEALYRRATVLGLEYGPAFRTLESVAFDGPDGLDCTLRAPLPLMAAGDALHLPPALLDGAFHGLLALLDRAGALDPGAVLLPVAIRSLRLSGDGGAVRRARIRLTARRSRTAEADIVLADVAGRVLARLEGCLFQRAALPGRVRPLDERLWHFVAVPSLAGPERGSAPSALATALADLPAPAAPPRRLAEAALLTEAYVAATAHEALARILPADRPVALDLLAREGRLAADAVPLAERLLTMLAEDGAAESASGLWRLAAESGLPQAAEIWRSALAEAPDLVSELAAAGRAAAELTEVLAQGLPGRIASPATLEHLVAAGPITGAPAVAEAARALGAVIAAWPKDRPLRVLEVAGGAGTLLRAVAPMAEAAAVHLAWTLTDPDESTLHATATRLGPAPGRRFVRFDPATADDRDVPGPFDLVTGAGLSFLRLAQPAALAALTRRLAEGGAAVFAVPAPARLVDLVFGRDPAWWERPSARAGSSPRFWHGALADAGLSDVAVLAPAAGVMPGSAILAIGRRTEAREQAVPVTPVVLVAEAETPGAMLAAAVATRLGRRGRSARVVTPDALPPLEPQAELVLLGDGRCSQDPAAAACARGVLALRLSAAAAAAKARLWLVARGAVQPDGVPEAHDPAEAALWGLGRVVCNEMPGIESRLIDLSPRLAPVEAVHALLAELGAPDDETEIVWTPAGRRVLRLLRARSSEAAASGGGLALAVGQPGLMEALRWSPAPRRRPGPGEIEIAVAAAGLNFRDVMWAQGLLPETLLADGFAGPTLGMECAGTVAAIGSDVAGLSVGDRVVAFAPAALATHAVTLAAASARLPQAMSFAEGATIPVAFLTALYALDELGRLRAGETVLIHGGAGGVGLAALQIAERRGARVIATAGTVEKRALLRLAGAAHVFDSRNLGFVDGVREATGGRGVDVVLNSLAGEAMEASLGLLRPFGRFIELGKRDFALNTRAGLRPLARNIAYFGVDLDAVMAADSALAARLFAELAELAAAGAIRPLPHRVLPGREVRDAFRLMQGSGHIGKIVLTPPSPAPARARRDPVAEPVRDDRTYVVTGGLGGLGLEVARQLAAQGARHLALLSRRGVADEAGAAVLAELERGGVTIARLACDVADAAALEATLAAIRSSMAPIGGVVHAAAVLADATLGGLDEARLAATLAPKLAGAWNLHCATREDPIGLFVLFSSATTAIGNPGQGAYVAANHALEALARLRRAEGLPAVAIGWGPVAETGMLARAPELRRLLEHRLGLRAMPVTEMRAALARLLAGPQAAVHVAELDGAQAGATLPILAAPTFAEARLPVQDAAAGRHADDLRATLAALPPAEARSTLEAALTAEVARILGLAPQAVDRSRPLADLGMDSLMAVELGLALEQRLGSSALGVSVGGGVSVATLAAQLLPELRGEQTVVPSPGPLPLVGRVAMTRAPTEAARAGE